MLRSEAVNPERERWFLCRDVSPMTFFFMGRIGKLSAKDWRVNILGYADCIWSLPHILPFLFFLLLQPFQ